MLQITALLNYFLVTSVSIAQRIKQLCTAHFLKPATPKTIAAAVSWVPVCKEPGCSTCLKGSQDGWGSFSGISSSSPELLLSLQFIHSHHFTSPTTYSITKGNGQFSMKNSVERTSHSPEALHFFTQMASNTAHLREPEWYPNTAINLGWWRQVHVGLSTVTSMPACRRYWWPGRWSKFGTSVDKPLSVHSILLGTEAGTQSTLRWRQEDLQVWTLFWLCNRKGEQRGKVTKQCLFVWNPTI